MKTEYSNRTSTLYLTPSVPRLALGTTVDQKKNSKLVSLVRPARLPLPYSFCSVEVFPAASGVDVCDPDTGRSLLHLDSKYDQFEEEWAELLPIFSAVYVEGDSDGRTDIFGIVAPWKSSLAKPSSEW